jgi:hypothetical protein
MGHIDAQILIFAPHSLSMLSPSADLVSPQHMQTLNDVKRDVVDTICQVINIVMKQGSALKISESEVVEGCWGKWR